MRTPTKIKSSRYVSQNQKVRQPTDFELWFVQCIQICTNDTSYPDYKWDLKHCDIWRKRFKDGLSPLDAVQVQFKAH
jgi:hypothetical protein